MWMKLYLTFKTAIQSNFTTLLAALLDHTSCAWPHHRPNQTISQNASRNPIAVDTSTIFKKMNSNVYQHAFHSTDDFGITFASFHNLGLYI